MRADNVRERKPGLELLFKVLIILMMETFMCLTDRLGVNLKDVFFFLLSCPAVGCPISPGVQVGFLKGGLSNILLLFLKLTSLKPFYFPVKERDGAII